MTSKEIKAEARGFLKGQWVKASVMFLVYTLIASAAVMICSVIGIVTGSATAETISESPLYFAGSILGYVFQAMLMIGYASIILKIASGRSWEFGDLFKSARYTFKTLGLVLLMTVYIMLWTCLFIIPGIVKAFSYSMALYILAEDPTKGINQCITESKEMMKGNKRKLFGLVLSFFGWMLLAVIVIYVVILIVAFAAASLGELVGIIAFILVLLVSCVAMVVLELPFLVYIEVSRAVFYYDISGNGGTNNNLTDEQIQNSVELGDAWQDDFGSFQ